MWNRLLCQDAHFWREEGCISKFKLGWPEHKFVCLLVFKLPLSLIAQLVKNPPAMWETPVWSLETRWRRERLPSPVFLGFPCGSVGKETACNARDLGSIPVLERYPGERKGYPLQYSDLEKSMDCWHNWVTFTSQTFWGACDRWKLYVFQMYNVMFWCMYTLWNYYNSQPY